LLYLLIGGLDRLGFLGRLGTGEEGEGEEEGNDQSQPVDRGSETRSLHI